MLFRSRVQLQNKDPRGWSEFANQLADHSTQGSALTMRGVQKQRPSLWSLRSSMRSMSVPICGPMRLGSSLRGGSRSSADLGNCPRRSRPMFCCRLGAPRKSIFRRLGSGKSIYRSSTRPFGQSISATKTHFLTKTRQKVSTEMSLHVLAYNLKRMMAILGVVPLLAAIRA